ncbi:MAG: hypothetical protein IT464_08200 [Planctomycetes bacterium]|nr:hypothetical protein [Planctomycetota bacterium]
MGRRYNEHARLARAWASGDMKSPPPQFPADVMTWLQAHKQIPHYARILAHTLESNAMIRDAHREACQAAPLPGGGAATLAA